MTSGRFATGKDGTRLVIDEFGRRYVVLGDQFGAGPDSRLSFTGQRTGRKVAPVPKITAAESPPVDQA